MNQLQGGQLDLMHTSVTASQTDQLRDLTGQVKLLTQKPGFREIHYYFLLTRQAAVRRPERPAGVRDGARPQQDQPDPHQGHLRGREQHHGPRRARLREERRLPEVQPEAGEASSSTQYKAAHGGTFDVILGTTEDQESSLEMQLVEESSTKVGINADIAQFDQATQINKALSGDIDMLDWRNLHGGCTEHTDESTYIWFAELRHRRHRELRALQRPDHAGACSTTAAGSPTPPR